MSFFSRFIHFSINRYKFYSNPINYFRTLGVKIGSGTCFYGPRQDMFSSEPYLVKIGNDCHISYDVSFIPHDGSALLLRKSYPDLDIVAPIVVGDRVFIGAHSTLLAGVMIGNDCIIAAGSVVTKNVEAGSVVGGVPARLIKTYDEWKRDIIQKSTFTKGLSESEKREKLLEIYKDILS